MASRKFDPKLLPITSAVASALLASACAPSQDRASTDVAVCRDAAGKRVDDSQCARPHHGGGGAIVGLATWYYLSRGSMVPGMGQSLAGGSMIPRAGVGYARASASSVSRGGFGMSARGGGGGE